MLRRRRDAASCVRRDPASYVQGPRSRVVRSRSLVDHQRPTIAALQGQPSSARIHPRESTRESTQVCSPIYLIGDADGWFLNLFLCLGLVTTSACKCLLRLVALRVYVYSPDRSLCVGNACRTWLHWRPRTGAAAVQVAAQQTSHRAQPGAGALRTLHPTPALISHGAHFLMAPRPQKPDSLASCPCKPFPTHNALRVLCPTSLIASLPSPSLV